MSAIRPCDDPRWKSRAGRIARVEAARRLIVQSARDIGYANGLKWRDRDGACLWDKAHDGKETLPAETLAAYREAWARGSAAAMAARPVAASCRLAGPSRA